MVRMTNYQKLLFVTCLATFGLIALGGVVRITESGLGCPDWPRCNGELTPHLRKDAIIEYSHRIAAMTVGLLVFSSAALALKNYRRHPTVLVPAAMAFALLIAQVILGAVTVDRELPGEIVAAHLAVAVAMLGTLLVATVSTFFVERGASPWATPSLLPSLALLAALSAFALILTGSYVAGSEAGLAFRDWPLFNGSVLPSRGEIGLIHFTHRVTAGFVGILVAIVFVQAKRDNAAPKFVKIMSTIALSVYAAQVLIGAANIWTELQPALAVLHLATAAALWSCLVVLTASAYQNPQTAPARQLVRNA